MLDIFGMQVDTGKMLAFAFLILASYLVLMAIRTGAKKMTPYKTGGEIVVNRNDPTRDYIRWELMSWPDDWKDGDRLIFTVVEHKVVQSGPEVEVKK